ncbi:MAG: phage distal tail protein [Clostridium sp.]
MSLSLYFNDVKKPSWVKVSNISTTLLPQNGQKNIVVDFFFKKSTLLSIEKIIEFQDWIKGDDFKPSKLVLPNDLNSYYIATVKNTVDLNGANRKGTGKIEFSCSPANRIEFEVQKNTLNNKLDLYYIGNVAVYPTLEVAITSQCEEVVIKFNNSKYSNYIKFVGSFNRGDLISINQNTNKVTLNNKLNFPILTLDSKRHKLVPGYNFYTLHSGNANVDIIYQNEYL